MKISDILKQKNTFSFEVFPPKEGQPLEPLLNTLDILYRYKPDFVSCTYGAGGSNKGLNLEVCRHILDSAFTPVSHFTCIGANKDEIKGIMDEYISIGIENVLALRGDLPKGWAGTGGDFAHADELMSYLHEICPGLCIGVAGYPEKHIEAISFEQDILHLKVKQENGAQFITTQICHNLDSFERYLELIMANDIDIPVIAGLMPVLFREGTVRMTLSNGCSIPGELAQIIGKFEHDPAGFKEAGKEYTVKQIERFLKTGISGLHIYTMNKHEDLVDILNHAGY